MALIETYVCDTCAYDVLVSGKPDALLKGPTMTVSCPACNALSDVLLTMVDPPPKPRCPNCRSRRAREWTGPGPCPKCPGRMTVAPGREAMLAD